MNPAFRKVVVVDDDSTALRVVSKCLTATGYDVFSYINAEDALEFMQADCPDFLVTDWIMNSMSGIELCQKVRSLSLPHYV